MILNGEHVIIKADGVAIAAAKSCTINITVDTDEVANPSNGKWKKFIMGRMGWQVTLGHLVTTLLNNIQMVGKSVTLEMGVTGAGLPFDGFVDNVSVEQQSLPSPAQAIYWDKTNKRFVAMFQSSPLVVPKYYMNWINGDRYITPSSYDLFLYDNATYLWLNSDLSAEKLTGSAIVTTWNGTFTKANLAQGSFEFLGDGALTPASLPST